MVLYAATIFLSAFLLFLVQPIIAKQILPWFGGAASVWAICLVFFQSVLLAGYAYADWTTRYLKPRTQAWLHVAVLALSIVTLPILPDARWKPAGDAEPTMAILGLLALTIGLPYFLLSTTSPLVQSWYWQKFRSGVPYRLFALSNFASLLALLSYPVAFEPWISAKAQSWGWSGAYVLFAVLCGVTALTSAAHAQTARRQEEPVTEGPPLAWSQYALWIVLSAMGSCLLLAVTNHLTQNIASVPFLWVVPLSLYLITFILCFDHPRWYVRKLFLPLAAVAVLVMAWQIDEINIYRAAPLYGAGLFILCMFCHGELTQLKPGPQHLTRFYLMISVGGAFGALLIGIIAPAVLNGYYELGLCLLAVTALLFVRTLPLARWIPAVAILLMGGTGVLLYKAYAHYHEDTRIIMRNFYGVVRTKDFDNPVPFRAMYHGGINHGGQLLDPEYKRRPSTYFGVTSGYGRLFASLPPGPREVGILGLGAGAIAAYARPGDHFVFWEIDPQVAAVTNREFTFLRDSGAQIDIVLGDGRLSLERDKRKYDVLAMDAFSGDAIPMHLLTKEAMGIYVDHLKPDGAIIFQATNRFVDLMPAIAQLAEAYGMKAVLISDWPDEGKGPDYWTSSTDQVIVTRNEKLLAQPKLAEVAKPLMPRPGFRIWTDDFYNMLRVLK
jgi:hypothetical protein